MVEAFLALLSAGIFVAHILDALLGGARAIPPGPDMRPASSRRSAAARQDIRDGQVLTCTEIASCTKVLSMIEPANDGADSSEPDGGDVVWYDYETERRPATKVLA
jgi:hypothetical protein